MEIEQIQEKYPTSSVVELTPKIHDKCVASAGGDVPSSEIENEYLIVGHQDVNGTYIEASGLTSRFSYLYRNINVKDGMLGIIVWHAYGTFIVSRSCVRKMLSEAG